MTTETKIDVARGPVLDMYLGHEIRQDPTSLYFTATGPQQVLTGRTMWEVRKAVWHYWHAVSAQDAPAGPTTAPVPDPVPAPHQTCDMCGIDMDPNTPDTICDWCLLASE